MEEPIGSSQPRCTSSQTLTTQGHWSQCLKHLVAEGRSSHEKVTPAKNRHDIAMCPGDTSVHMHKLQEIMSEAGHAPGNLPDEIIFASMFTDITWERRKVPVPGKIKTSDEALKNSRPEHGVRCSR